MDRSDVTGFWSFDVQESSGSVGAWSETWFSFNYDVVLLALTEGVAITRVPLLSCTSGAFTAITKQCIYCMR